MPLEDYGLPQAVIDALRTKVRKSITPRPATANPQIDKAISRLDKAGYKREIDNTNIKPMGMFDFYSGSNTLGQTMDDTNDINLNPHALALYPEYKNAGILAHELTHVRQNMLPGGLAENEKQRAIPYEQRPNEEEAFAASRNYEEGIPEDVRDQEHAQYNKHLRMYLRNALPDFIPFEEYAGLSQYGKK